MGVMLRHYLVIDGYNLMHACGLARKSYGPGQLRQCRVQLVRHLGAIWRARARTDVLNAERIGRQKGDAARGEQQALQRDWAPSMEIGAPISLSASHASSATPSQATR